MSLCNLIDDYNKMSIYNGMTVDGVQCKKPTVEATWTFIVSDAPMVTQLRYGRSSFLLPWHVVVKKGKDGISVTVVGRACKANGDPHARIGETRFMWHNYYLWHPDDDPWESCPDWIMNIARSIDGLGL